MEITADTVRELAELACLELEEEAVARMQHDLDAILAYVRLLDELDTDDVAPTSHVLDIATPLRDDVEAGVLPRSEVLRNGPRHDDESVIVPKVIE
jgi:aspartyl-tRNA(Asn)/glutamyl-tRNA(Gln) amidotransferase subunit C